MAQSFCCFGSTCTVHSPHIACKPAVLAPSTSRNCGRFASFSRRTPLTVRAICKKFRSRVHMTHICDIERLRIICLSCRGDTGEHTRNEYIRKALLTGRSQTFAVGQATPAHNMKYIVFPSLDRGHNGSRPIVVSSTPRCRRGSYPVSHVGALPCLVNTSK